MKYISNYLTTNLDKITNIKEENMKEYQLTGGDFFTHFIAMHAIYICRHNSLHLRVAQAQRVEHHTYA